MSHLFEIETNQNNRILYETTKTLHETVVNQCKDLISITSNQHIETEESVYLQDILLNVQRSLLYNFKDKIKK